MNSNSYFLFIYYLFVFFKVIAGFFPLWVCGNAHLDVSEHQIAPTSAFVKHLKTAD